MNKITFALLPVAFLAASCGQKASDSAQIADTAGASAATANATATADSVPVPAPAPTKAGFSIDNVPISNAPLGKFPFFGWPAGYEPQNKARSLDFGHFLFWTGTAFEDVEGRTYMATIVNHDEKAFSTYELKRNLEALFQQAGAVKITESDIPKTLLDGLPSATRQEMAMGLGDVWNDPAETWVIRRPNSAIWIHYTTNTAQGSLAVVQTKPFVTTAALLPADQLKTALDTTGKAIIHVNFATDRTEILPTSKDQMDAVTALLKADPTLKLAINGYTDDTGSDDHNVTLSDGRAKAVLAALVASGIAPNRLQAKGFGRLNPASANTDEAGKAANRRVELIKV